MESFLLLLLAVVGLLIALYFVLVYYGLLRPDTRLVPAVCRMSDDSCQLVIRHPDAHIFSLPNAVYGVGFYLLLIVSILFPDTSFLHTAVLVVSWISVAVGIYLIYSLFFKIKIPCPLCLTAHGINIVLAVVLTAL